MKSPLEIAAEVSQLCQSGKATEGMALALSVLEERDMTALHKVRVALAIAIRHPEEAAALPLLDRHRDLFLSAGDFACEAFAFYEERLRGSSSFTDALPKEVQALVNDAKAFWQANPIDIALAEATKLMTGALKAHQARDAILTALHESRSFSLIRMGDGEGRFVLPLEAKATKARSEEIANRIWFWNSTSHPDEAFWSSMSEAYYESDVVGANPTYRIGLEYRNSFVGYVGVVHGNRFLAQCREKGAESLIAANWVLSELGVSFFKEIMRNRTVGFIGPHAQISPALRSMGASNVDLIVVPSDNIVPTAVMTPHYPDAYRKVLARIAQGVSGLWLVSAGPYGKIYCNEIKRHGGIALDVGSISDQWMNLKTR